jgi:hypothetical protein
VDLAYATTGHRAQGLTRWRALVRLTGREDSNWLYVQLSRARHETTLYPVVGPEPQGPVELDLPDLEAPDGYRQLAQALTRAGEQTLAIDTRSTLDLRQLTIRELRAERDRLRAELDQAPRDRARELERASRRRADADRVLAEVTRQADQQRQATGMLGRLRRGGQATAIRDGAVKVATQQADRAADRELELRQHQQRRAGWLEANTHLVPAYQQVQRELAWQQRARGLALEYDQTTYVREALGLVPESTRGRRSWRQAAAAIEDYRRSYQITDPERALGPEPRDQVQRAAWRQARTTIGRVHAKQRTSDRTRDQQPALTQRSPVERTPQDPARTRPDRELGRGRSSPERAAG